MDEETEKRLHRVEVESAACYADMEDAAHRFHMLALELEGHEGIPDEIEEEASVVNQINALSMRLKGASEA